MPRLKRLTVRAFLRILGRFGFEVISMKGSHAKLARVKQKGGNAGTKEILVVSMHRKLSVGTIHAIYRQACRFIPEDDLREDFFSD
ncbi:MAG: type II toxin-antitoxin system HicA family toxin [Gammaproteobacteria bacterium]|nr:type II toxin-antitoxin system HicA family toxin [Gammaproteobacteria bacterium]MCY4281835.1 type II toxin-antitoxin system HicA family toxin [Gammaproteobacteria bacterium]